MAMSLENKKDVIILDMDEQIYILARELKEEIDRDPRFIRLSELEKKMSENEERNCQSLSPWKSLNLRP